ncbi:MAG: hypothetical protein JNK82_28720 [Myxococcaceae bacterium]|nr:hypothetical protein [Myxococcaceae bacterium]
MPCTDCDGTCVDLQADSRHCGACGTTCRAGSVCRDGQCAVSCSTVRRRAAPTAWTRRSTRRTAAPAARRAAPTRRARPAPAPAPAPWASSCAASRA